MPEPEQFVAGHGNVLAGRDIIINLSVASPPSTCWGGDMESIIDKLHIAVGILISDGPQADRVREAYDVALADLEPDMLADEAAWDLCWIRVNVRRNLDRDDLLCQSLAERILRLFYRLMRNPRLADS